MNSHCWCAFNFDQSAYTHRNVLLVDVIFDARWQNETRNGKGGEIEGKNNIKAKTNHLSLVCCLEIKKNNINILYWQLISNVEEKNKVNQKHEGYLRVSFTATFLEIQPSSPSVPADALSACVSDAAINLRWNDLNTFCINDRNACMKYSSITICPQSIRMSSRYAGNCITPLQIEMTKGNKFIVTPFPCYWRRRFSDKISIPITAVALLLSFYLWIWTHVETLFLFHRKSIQGARGLSLNVCRVLLIAAPQSLVKFTQRISLQLTGRVLSRRTTLTYFYLTKVMGPPKAAPHKTINNYSLSSDYEWK